jgi:hypothetical protein
MHACLTIFFANDVALLSLRFMGIYNQLDFLGKIFGEIIFGDMGVISSNYRNIQAIFNI